MTMEKSMVAFADEEEDLPTEFGDLMEELLAEGRAEGEAKGKIEIAREMKKGGVDPKTITKYTGLSADEIRRLD